MEKSYSASYAAAGVDITAGYRSVELMKQYVARTMTESCIGGLGGFGGLFELDCTGMEHPVLLKQMIQADYGVGAGVSTDQPVRSFEASDALGALFRYLDYWAGGLVEEGRTWDSTKNASKKSPVIVPWCRLKRNGVRRESMGKNTVSA